MVKTISVALIGNPNTGKSSVFNTLTGLKQAIGNYPGVTVEKKIGNFENFQLPVLAPQPVEQAPIPTPPRKVISKIGINVTSLFQNLFGLLYYSSFSKIEIAGFETVVK